MSLQVWLPLTKDLRQQGLSSATVNGGIISNNGKLGQCYLVNSSNPIIITHSLTTTTEFSFAFWMKIPTNMGTNTGWEQMIRFNAINVAGGSTSTTVINWASYQAVKIYDDSKHQWLWAYPGTNFSYDKWHHWSVTHTANGDGVTGKIYIDGVLIGTYNNTTDPLKLVSGTISFGNTVSVGDGFYLNDVRIYDHCLSPMEVKELAKGLVLHYPLNKNGWGNDNILLNTHFDSRYTQSTGWDTTKNGTLLANSWGGYNSGVTNASTVYHAHLKQFNDEYVYEYIKTTNESWLGISQGGLQNKLTAGKTYTFSWEEYHVEGTNRVGTGLYYYKTGATSANFHLGIQQAANVTRVIGKWQKFVYTFEAPTDADWSKNMSWYVYGHYNSSGTFYVRHIKLEEGSIATPWTPNSSDILATTMGLNGTIEYDCSGYCNNGTYSALPTVTSDTPKYSVSSLFGAYNTPNLITNTASTLCPALSNCTIAWWQKSNGAATLLFTGQTTSYYVAASNANNYYHSNAGSPIMYRDGVAGTYQNTTGVWHHYVLTGVNLSTWTTLKLNSYSSGWPVNGYVSDLRIYATALSADDVKSLYQNSAYIDSSGNVYGAVHTEV